MDKVPEVLFVCVHNAGRSQMAAALMKRRSEGRIWARSAGSEPATVVNPLVVAALAEMDIDISAETPKRLSRADVEAVDVVVTTGCGDACPILPTKQYFDWDLPDPSVMGLDGVRMLRDIIDMRVKALIDEILPRSAAPREAVQLGVDAG